MNVETTGAKKARRFSPKIIVLVTLTGIIITAGVGLGIGASVGWFNKGVKLSMSLQNLKTSTRFTGQSVSNPSPTEAIKINTHFSFMILDGFKVTVTSLQLYPSGQTGNGVWKTVSSASQDVYFGRAYDGVTVTIDATVPAGSYIGAN